MHILFVFQILLLAVTTKAFEHPGLLVSNHDIARIKTKLSAKRDPWQSSWTKLLSLDLSQATYTNNAVASVNRAASGNIAANAELLWHDAAAAFNLGLRWKIEGDAECARAASQILVGWAENLQSLGDTDDQYLVAGLQGYQLVNAAELLVDYQPFVEAGRAIFTEMFEKVFLSKNLFFLNHQAPSEHNHRHFFANWELCNMASAMAFGVFSENQTLFDFVVDYFKTGTGNGAISQGISNLVSEPGTGVVMGQLQEAGRDQGHSGLDIQLWGVVAQQAWNQQVDLYGYDDNRILQGAEYFARYNLGYDVPFEPYTNGIVSFDKISADSRGAYRPTWELFFAHYSQVRGLSASWTEKYKNYTVESMGGFEGGAGSWGEGSGHYDGLGWGSLLYHLDDGDFDSSVPQPTRSSMKATTFTSSVQLSLSSIAGTDASSLAASTTAPGSSSLTPPAIQPTAVSPPSTFVTHSRSSNQSVNSNTIKSDVKASKTVLTGADLAMATVKHHCRARK